MSLINGKAQVEDLELAKVAVQNISAGDIVPCAPHILAQSVDGPSLFRVFFWVVLVGDSDVSSERRHPVDLVRPLERN